MSKLLFFSVSFFRSTITEKITIALSWRLFQIACYFSLTINCWDDDRRADFESSWEQLSGRVKREILISELFRSHDFVIQSTDSIYSTCSFHQHYRHFVFRSRSPKIYVQWQSLANFGGLQFHETAVFKFCHAFDTPTQPSTGFCARMICFQLFLSQNLKRTLLSERREQWADYRERVKILARVINFNKFSLFCAGRVGVWYQKKRALSSPL